MDNKAIAVRNNSLRIHSKTMDNKKSTDQVCGVRQCATTKVVHELRGHGHSGHNHSGHNPSGPYIKKLCIALRIISITKYK